MVQSDTKCESKRKIDGHRGRERMKKIKAKTERGGGRESKSLFLFIYY